MSTKKPVFIVGIGELGSVFARGLLRLGHPIYPVTRDMRAQEQAERAADPELVLVAVGETELTPVLRSLPDDWRSSTVLVQNELLPYLWQGVLFDPTVVVVWFEKKRGQDVRVLLPSIVHGPKADIVTNVLGELGIPVRTAETPGEIEIELVAKNLYILTTNIAGMNGPETVEELWSSHRDHAVAVASDVLDIQRALLGRELPKDALMTSLEHAIGADLTHRCAGRTARARLERALAHADRFGIAAPALRRCASR